MLPCRTLGGLTPFSNLVHNLEQIVPGVGDILVREGTEGFLELWLLEKDRGEINAASRTSLRRLVSWLPCVSTTSSQRACATR